MSHEKVKINVTYNPHEIQTKKWSKKYEKYRKKWTDNPQHFKVEKFPLHLDIELTNRCNYKCYMCAFQSDKALFKPDHYEDMDFELYKKIIDEGAEKGLCAIKLNFRGEPLLYNKIVEAVRYAKDRGIMDVMFNTNGSLLTPKLCKELIDAGLDKILFSVDEYESNKYDKTRIGGNFRKVYRNIQDMWVLRALHNKDNPQITINRIAFPGRPKEDREEFIKYWSKLADIVGEQMYLDYNHIIYDNETSEWQCAFLWQRLVILADGTVLSCCGMPHKEKVLGNVRDQSIELLWHSEKMDYIRTCHKQKHSEQFIACAVCPMRHKLISKS